MPHTQDETRTALYNMVTAIQPVAGIEGLPPISFITTIAEGLSAIVGIVRMTDIEAVQDRIKAEHEHAANYIDCTECGATVSRQELSDCSDDLPICIYCAEEAEGDM